jgi:RNA polymerase sigma factor (sigma-70 family)
MRYDYELRPYYRELNRIPVLAKEEQQRLLAALSARAQPLSVQRATPLTHRLIEGHLALASRIAREHCPPSRYTSLLPDLVQEANLALIQATEQFASTHDGDFTDYVCAWMRAGVKGAVSRAALPIAVPYHVRVRAREEGTLDQWYRLQPVSLDRLLNEEEREESSLVATLVAPSMPETPPPARDESTRAFVEQLLSYLSPRARAVLHLRHGLFAEDDERPRTTGEIAQELDITPNEVSAYERDGLWRLQALVKGEARLLPYQGRVAISLGGTDAPTLEHQQRQDIAQERRERLVQASQQLREQGVKVTIDRLVEATGVPTNLVAAFLRELRGKQDYRTGTDEERVRARWQRLEEAYRQLAAAGTPPSGQALARQAHTRQDTARAFLKARAQQ